MSGFKKVLLVAAWAGALGYYCYTKFGPQTATTASAATDDLASCPNGTVECPNNCLKREADGWRHLNVNGHPDMDIWMQFTNARGETVAYNQHHIGHVIEPVNGQYTDTGTCPVCKGKTRVCR